MVELIYLEIDPCSEKNRIRFIYFKIVIIIILFLNWLFFRSDELAAEADEAREDSDAEEVHHTAPPPLPG